jgi:hypothetical protein
MAFGGNLPSELGALNTTIEPIPWRGFRAIDKLIIIVLPALATGLVLLPFLDQALLRRLARLVSARRFIPWLLNGSGTWMIAGSLLLLLALFVWWRRRAIMGEERLLAGAGCPNCHERELVRVSRHFSDRFYGLAAIPAYRYACRSCTWRGLRIGRCRHLQELDEELEAALLRFDPNASLLERQALPDPEGAPVALARAGSVFRDVGDVTWAADAPVSSDGYAAGREMTDEDDAGGESVDELEWVWQGLMDNTDPDASA